MYSPENVVIAEFAYPNRQSISIEDNIEDTIDEYSTEIIIAEVDVSHDVSHDDNLDTLFNPTINDIIYNYCHIFTISGSINNYNNRLILLREKSEILYNFIYLRDDIIKSCIGALFINIVYTFLNPFNIINFVVLLLNIYTIAHSGYNMYQAIIILNILSMIYILITNLSLSMIMYSYYFVAIYNNNTVNYTMLIIYLISLYLFSFTINMLYVNVIGYILKLKTIYKQLVSDRLISRDT